MVVDIGTGDGRAVLRRAHREPRALFVGIDAVAEAMRKTSHRAARPPRRGGQANALFLVAPAEELPGPLSGRAHEVTVVLPWGSLLRGLAAPETELVERICGLLRAGGRLELLLSVGESDRPSGLPVLDRPTLLRLAADYASLGLECEKLRPATAADVERLSSSWARRLGIPNRRAAWLLAVRRSGWAALRLLHSA